MASGVTGRAQQRALLPHISWAGVSDIYYTYDEAVRGADDTGDFDLAVMCLENHFKEKKNVPMASQAFLHTELQPRETVNNFVTRLKTSVNDCEYVNGETDNQVLAHLKDKSLKSKLFREKDLTLQRLVKLAST
jgi:hypothetical protein